jgi:DNA repair protein RadC
MPGPQSISTQEVLTAAYLDEDGNVQHLLTMSDGRTDAVSLPLRAIVQEALTQDCSRIILLHNHPSGDPSPSDADIRATRLLHRTTSALDLELIDHLILADGRCFSFRAAGLL